MFVRLRRWVLDPHPMRTLAIGLTRRLKLGSYEQRLRLGAVERPAYGYCVYHAARLARRLGYPRFSVLELGVAGGEGLVNLEAHAAEASRLFGVEIEIYGFDSGAGLPEPVDYRDVPYHWKKGFYRMDVARLQGRLRTARLVLGDIRETARAFFGQFQPAPIGAIVFDLDFYSSTAAALKLLEGGDRWFLPRLFCVFDDTVGQETELYNEYTGERLAIEEFNREHEAIKITAAHHLLALAIPEVWHHKIRIVHLFSHGRYCDFVSTDDQQLPCG